MIHPKFIEAVRRLYPSANFVRDVELQDDGEGPYLKSWNLPGGPPTDAEIDAVMAQPPPPEPITKRQALLYLLSIGKTEANVEAAIDAITDPTAREAARIEWRYPDGPLSADHPLLKMLAPAVGIDVADLPAAFDVAVKL
jgi:hypothetical protein